MNVPYTFIGNRAIYIQATRDNREEVVDQWIHLLSGPDASDLNKKDSLGYAPLHYATKFNRYKILVKLVQAGAGGSKHEVAIINYDIKIV